MDTRSKGVGTYQRIGLVAVAHQCRRLYAVLGEDEVLGALKQVLLIKGKPCFAALPLAMPSFKTLHNGLNGALEINILVTEHYIIIHPYLLQDPRDWS